MSSIAWPVARPRKVEKINGWRSRGAMLRTSMVEVAAVRVIGAPLGGKVRLIRCIKNTSSLTRVASCGLDPYQVNADSAVYAAPQRAISLCHIHFASILRHCHESCPTLRHAYRKVAEVAAKP